MNNNKQFTSKKLILFALFVFIFVSCETAKDKLANEIKLGEAKLFSDSVKALNIDESNTVFNNYLVYADTYKDDTSSANYLFKAADLANGLSRPKESIAIYERLRISFPEYRKASSALFMQAFIYETSIKDKEKAKEKYKEFILKYPEHKLTASAQASWDQLNANLSDEELIKSFEAKNK